MLRNRFFHATLLALFLSSMVNVYISGATSRFLRSFGSFYSRTAQKVNGSRLTPQAKLGAACSLPVLMAASAVQAQNSSEESARNEYKTRVWQEEPWCTFPASVDQVITPVDRARDYLNREVMHVRKKIEKAFSKYERCSNRLFTWSCKEDENRVKRALQELLEVQTALYEAQRMDRYALVTKTDNSYSIVPPVLSLQPTAINEPFQASCFGFLNIRHSKSKLVECIAACALYPRNFDYNEKSYVLARQELEERGLQRAFAVVAENMDGLGRQYGHIPNEAEEAEIDALAFELLEKRWMNDWDYYQKKAFDFLKQQPGIFREYTYHSIENLLNIIREDCRYYEYRKGSLVARLHHRLEGDGSMIVGEIREIEGLSDKKNVQESDLIGVMQRLARIKKEILEERAKGHGVPGKLEGLSPSTK